LAAWPAAAKPLGSSKCDWQWVIGGMKIPPSGAAIILVPLFFVNEFPSN